MNPVTDLQRAARQAPDAPAIFRGRAPWATYGQLALRVARLACGLRERLGLAPGERVAIAMKNSPEYLEALYAAWWAGLAVVPVNAKLREGSGVHRRGLALAPHDRGAGRCAIGSRDGLRRGRSGGARLASTPAAPQALKGRDALAPQSRADDARLLRGRGPRRAAGRAAAARTSVARLRPLQLHPPLPRRAQVVRGVRRFDPAEVLDLLEAHGNVSMFAAPTMVKRLAGCGRILRSARPGASDAGVRGGPMYLADLQRATAAFGQRLAQIYGQGREPHDDHRIVQVPPCGYAPPAPPATARLGGRAAQRGRGDDPR